MKTKTILITALAFVSTVLKSNAVLLDFDSVTAGPGVDASAYLSSFGISLSNVSHPGTVEIFSDTNFYGSTVVSAPSPHNFLLQQVGGAPNGIFYTMNFSTPLTNFSFTRIAITVPSQVAQWTATAYAGVSPVGSVGENFFGGTEASQPYALSGAGITSVTITANGFNSAAIASAPLDNFNLTQVPEPSSALFLLSGGLLMLRRRSLRTTDRNA